MTSVTSRVWVIAGGLSLGLLLAAAPSDAQTITPVMTGLDAPRGLAWGPEGGLYVTEAGDGTATGPCTAVVAPPNSSNCYSETGKISRLFHGQQERVATGLPSIFNTVRRDIVGPNDISFQGRGSAFVTIGWGGNPSLRANLGGGLGSKVGVLVQVQPSGRWHFDADISDFERANNPAGGPVDSNPYGVLVLSGDKYVTDAGGNALLRVAANGNVSLVATLPTAPNGAEPVPTEVERGPDGALYVSLLTGVPFTAGAAGVYKIVDGNAQLAQGGFKTVIDFTFGPDGSMYVLENATSPTGFGGPGRLTRVAPDGARTVITTALNRPTSVLVGDDGAIYVSNNGVSVGTGEVLRIQP